MAFCHAGESNLWAERRRHAQNRGEDVQLAGLPAGPLPALGRVSRAVDGFMSESPLPSGAPAWLARLAPHATLRELHLSARPNAPFILHVQDAHEVEEAQRHISALLQALPADVRLVGVEGAAGPFAIDAFRAFPNAEITAGLAEHFLKEGPIGGAEHAGLTAARPPFLWGVETQADYDAHVRALLEARRDKPALDAWLASAAAAAAGLKKDLYSPELLEFDRRAAAHQSHAAGLGEHATFLASFPGGEAYPTLVLFQRALALEKKLDFNQLEKDRGLMVEVLARRLPRAALDALVQRSLDLRLGRAGQGDYHRFLRDLCARHGLALSSFGQMDAYVDYVLLADRLSRAGLLDELARRETAVQDALARTPEQKRVAAAVRRLALLEKLSRQGMTPDEWGNYEAQWDAVRRLPEELRVDAFPVPLAPFEDFCRLALRRNQSLTDNLLAKMEEQKASVAVLVAGGFHTPGLTEAFRRQGASWAVLAPHITEVPQGHDSLEIFTRDLRPLEKIFAGEPISLKYKPVLAAGPSRTPQDRSTAALFTAAHRAFSRAAGAPLSDDDLKALGGALPDKVALKDSVKEKGYFTVHRFDATVGGHPFQCEAVVTTREKLDLLKTEFDFTEKTLVEATVEGTPYVMAVFRAHQLMPEALEEGARAALKTASLWRLAWQEGVAYPNPIGLLRAHEHRDIREEAQRGLGVLAMALTSLGVLAAPLFLADPSIALFLSAALLPLAWLAAMPVHVGYAPDKPLERIKNGNGNGVSFTLPSTYAAGREMGLDDLQTKLFLSPPWETFAIHSPFDFAADHPMGRMNAFEKAYFIFGVTALWSAGLIPLALGFWSGDIGGIGAGFAVTLAVYVTGVWGNVIQHRKALERAAHPSAGPPAQEDPRGLRGALLRATGVQPNRAPSFLRRRWSRYNPFEKTVLAAGGLLNAPQMLLHVLLNVVSEVLGLPSFTRSDDAPRISETLALQSSVSEMLDNWKEMGLIDEDYDDSFVWKLNLTEADEDDLPYPDGVQVLLSPHGIPGLLMAPHLSSKGAVKGVNFLVMPIDGGGLRRRASGERGVYVERAFFFDRNGRPVLGRFRKPLPVQLLDHAPSAETEEERRLLDASLPALNSQAGTERSEDKRAFSRMLGLAGVRVPRGLPLEEEMSEAETAARLSSFAGELRRDGKTRGVVVKPNREAQGQGVKMFPFGQEAEAAAHFKALAAEGRAPIVEERVGNDLWKDPATGLPYDWNLRVITLRRPDGSIHAAPEMVESRFKPYDGNPNNKSQGASILTLPATVKAMGLSGSAAEKFTEGILRAAADAHRAAGADAIIGWDMILSDGAEWYFPEGNMGVLGGLQTVEGMLEKDEKGAAVGSTLQPLKALAAAGAWDASKDAPGDVLPLPIGTWWLIPLFETFIKRQMVQSAIDLANKILKMELPDFDRARVWAMIAEQHFKSGHYAHAEEYYRVAFKFAPDTTWAAMGLVSSVLNQGKSVFAEPAFLALAALSRLDWLYWKGLDHVSRHDFLEAETCARMIISDAEDEKTQRLGSLLLAMVFFCQGRMDEAHAALGGNFTVKPSDWSAVAALLAVTGQLESAGAILSRLQVDSTDVPVVWSAWRRFSLAKGARSRSSSDWLREALDHLKENSFKKAEEPARFALFQAVEERHEAGEADANEALADALMGQGLWEAAHFSYSRALEKAGEHSADAPLLLKTLVSRMRAGFPQGVSELRERLFAHIRSPWHPYYDLGQKALWEDLARFMEEDSLLEEAKMARLQAAQFVLRHWMEETPEDLTAALRFAGSFKSPDSLALLLGVLNSPTPEVRAEALKAIRGLPMFRVDGPLQRVAHTRSVSNHARRSAQHYLEDFPAWRDFKAAAPDGAPLCLVVEVYDKSSVQEYPGVVVLRDGPTLEREVLEKFVSAAVAQAPSPGEPGRDQVTVGKGVLIPQRWLDGLRSLGPRGSAAAEVLENVLSPAASEIVFAALPMAIGGFPLLLAFRPIYVLLHLAHMKRPWKEFGTRAWWGEAVRWTVIPAVISLLGLSFMMSAAPFPESLYGEWGVSAGVFWAFHAAVNTLLALIKLLWKDFPLEKGMFRLFGPRTPEEFMAKALGIRAANLSRRLEETRAQETVARVAAYLSKSPGRMREAWALVRKAPAGSVQVVSSITESRAQGAVAERLLLEALHQARVIRMDLPVSDVTRRAFLKGAMAAFAPAGSVPVQVLKEMVGASGDPWLQLTSPAAQALADALAREYGLVGVPLHRWERAMENAPAHLLEDFTHDDRRLDIPTEEFIHRAQLRGDWDRLADEYSFGGQVFKTPAARREWLKKLKKNAADTLPDFFGRESSVLRERDEAAIMENIMSPHEFFHAEHVVLEEDGPQQRFLERVGRDLWEGSGGDLLKALRESPAQGERLLGRLLLEKFWSLEPLHPAASRDRFPAEEWARRTRAVFLRLLNQGYPVTSVAERTQMFMKHLVRESATPGRLSRLLEPPAENAGEDPLASEMRPAGQRVRPPQDDEVLLNVESLDGLVQEKPSRIRVILGEARYLSPSPLGALEAVLHRLRLPLVRLGEDRFFFAVKRRDVSRLLPALDMTSRAAVTLPAPWREARLRELRWLSPSLMGPISRRYEEIQWTEDLAASQAAAKSRQAWAARAAAGEWDLFEDAAAAWDVPWNEIESAVDKGDPLAILPSWTGDDAEAFSGRVAAAVNADLARIARSPAAAKDLLDGLYARLGLLAALGPKEASPEFLDRLLVGLPALLDVANPAESKDWQRQGLKTFHRLQAWAMGFESAGARMLNDPRAAVLEVSANLAKGEAELNGSQETAVSLLAFAAQRLSQDDRAPVALVVYDPANTISELTPKKILDNLMALAELGGEERASLLAALADNRLMIAAATRANGLVGASDRIHSIALKALLHFPADAALFALHPQHWDVDDVLLLLAGGLLSDAAKSVHEDVQTYIRILQNA